MGIFILIQTICWMRHDYKDQNNVVEYWQYKHKHINHIFLKLRNSRQYSIII